MLIEFLLDDITAAALSHCRYPMSPGIRAGATGGWRDGAILTRAQLEAARAER